MNLAGQPVYAGFLPDPSGQPPPADRKQALIYREWRDRDVPVSRFNNPLLLSQQYKGTVYTCLSRIWRWLSGSTFIVEQRREAMRKAVGSSRRVFKANLGAAGEDEDWHPVEYGHPLKRLLHRPNRRMTPRKMISKLVIQVGTTGNWHLWAVRNGEGRPAELYSLPSALLQPLYGMSVTPQYPFGGWRLMPGYHGGMWGAVGVPANTNVPLDARDVFWYREPHPWLDQLGYGPVEAMAREVDVHEAVVTSRAASMARGVNPSMMIAAKGATQDQIDEVTARMNRDYGGADKHGKIFGLGSVDEIEATLLGQTPKDMDYPAGFEQTARALIAGFGIPPIVINLFDDGNYAQYWAAVQAWSDGVLEPFVGDVAEEMTLFFEPFYGEDVRVRIKLPKINDREAEESKFQFDVGQGLLTMNQALALRDRDPVEGGDVPVPAYMQQFAPQPAMGGPNDPNAGGQGADFSDHPLNALGDSILESLGVSKDAEHPGSDPFGDDGDDDVPDTDVDDDYADPFSRKAFGQYDESKHNRDHGKYSSKPGAQGRQRQNVGSSGQGPTNRPGSARTPLNPATARHPRVRAALAHLAENAANIAAKVNVAMLSAGIGPRELIGDQSSWETWFCTQYADAVAGAIGVDTQTAAAVLSHLIAHGVTAIKRHLKGSAEKASSPVARPAATRDTEGNNTASRQTPDRPVNSGGGGSLPNRLKAFDASSVSAFVDAVLAEPFAGVS